MTSLAQKLANQQNAQRSTGPKTPNGKARSSRNAYRHGLAASAVLSTEQNTFITNLAEALSQKLNGLEQKVLTRQIAEQEYHVMRARYVRRALLMNPQLRIAVEERRARSIPTKKAFRIITRAQDVHMLSQVKPVERKREIMHLFEFAKLVFYTKSLQLPDGFKFIKSQFDMIDRYERRAISKRNALIRQFVSLGALDGRDRDCC